MFSALALTTVLVQPGNTLSGISAAHGVSWEAVAAANPQLKNPNLIYPGEKLFVPSAKSAHGEQRSYQAPATAPAATPAPVQQSHYSSPSSSYVPTSGDSGFQSCVIQRESGGDPAVMNSSGHYGLYQFSASTWAEYGGKPADFGNASVAEQNQVFSNAMAAGGASNWSAYDGC